MTSSSKNLAHLTDKMGELCTEMHNVKNQVKKPQTSWDQRPRNQIRGGFSACWSLAMNGNVLTLFLLKIEVVISTVFKTQVNKDRSTNWILLLPS